MHHAHSLDCSRHKLWEGWAQGQLDTEGGRALSAWTCAVAVQRLAGCGMETLHAHTGQ